MIKVYGLLVDLWSIVDVSQVGKETLNPILFLLQSHDVEVQRPASAALANLAVNSKWWNIPFALNCVSCLTHTNIDPFTIAENKLLIVKLGGLEQLIRQMGSPNVEVQCNAVGCITNLATHGKSWLDGTMICSHGSLFMYTSDDNKVRIAKSDALRLLVDLARSKDQRVQRNATGALLNMTHTRKCTINDHHKIHLMISSIIIEDNRQQLVNAGAIPVLISLLSSQDADVQYYCTTALSNIAADGMLRNDDAILSYDLHWLHIIGMNRKKLAQTDSRLVQYLIALMETKSLKVQCQAALALRNLASDGKHLKGAWIIPSSLWQPIDRKVSTWDCSMQRPYSVVALTKVIVSSAHPVVGCMYPQYLYSSCQRVANYRGRICESIDRATILRRQWGDTMPCHFYVA